MSVIFFKYKDMHRRVCQNAPVYRILRCPVRVESDSCTWFVDESPHVVLNTLVDRALYAKRYPFIRVTLFSIPDPIPGGFKYIARECLSGAEVCVGVWGAAHALRKSNTAWTLLLHSRRCLRIRLCPQMRMN